MGALVLKRAAASRLSGHWYDDDLLCDGIVVGRIYNAAASWMWTLAFGHHEDRTSTHGYAATREAAIAAFEKSWRRGRAAIGVAAGATSGCSRWRDRGRKSLGAPAGFTGEQQQNSLLPFCYPTR